MRVISVVNYKGGVGKTTLTANLGAELARRGRRVLVVDLDPQCSLTHCFYTPSDFQMKIRPKQTLKHWYDSFGNSGIPHRGLAEFVVTPPEANHEIRARGGRGQLDLLASDVLLFKVDLDAAHLAIGADVDRELYLRRRALLDALRDHAFAAYDVVLLDCPPSFGLLTQSALVASQDVLMPAKADYMSTIGLDNLWMAIHKLRDDHSAEAARYGGRHVGGAVADGEYLVVFTMVQFMSKRPTAAHQFYIDTVDRELKIPFFRTVVRQSVAAFGDRSRPLPSVLELKDHDQIYGELMQLVDEFEQRFRLSTGGASLLRQVG
jgi:chromosome partitioning protein